MWCGPPDFFLVFFCPVVENWWIFNIAWLVLVIHFIFELTLGILVNGLDLLYYVCFCDRRQSLLSCLLYYSVKCTIHARVNVHFDKAKHLMKMRLLTSSNFLVLSFGETTIYERSWFLRHHSYCGYWFHVVMVQTYIVHQNPTLFFLWSKILSTF